ncbi:MAG: gamma carboxylase [Sandaracinus sp.]|nr:gamma carboxylase [Sandaracinus sp.]|tara:strand:+ start:501 stop:1904 length:1404 start_codon:yes stop_codon:yes gene_type:complete
MSAAESLVQRLQRRASEPVSGSSLAVFRVLYGLLAFTSASRALAMGWVDQFWVRPEVHLHYFGFEFVEPLSGPLMHGLFVAMAGLGLAIAAGLFTRWAAALHLVAFTYVELLDVSTYLNHYVLFSLLGFWVVVFPTGAALSLDARRRGRRAIPRGVLWVLRTQVGLVYVHAALAKVSADWLLHGQPLGIWFGARADLPLVGGLFTDPWLPWVALMAGWAGFLNDLLAPLLLSARRTRRWMFAVLVFFHGATSVLFDIGLFPLIMLSGATLYFAPDWPERLGRRWRRWSPSPSTGATPSFRFGAIPMALVVGFLAVQAVLPLRAHLYGGNVLWHEQGMRFSWRVLCRAKAGSVSYRVRWDGHARDLHVSPGSYLDRRQESEMAGQPDLILQLAHHIAADFRSRGHRGVEVRVDALASLNGRPMARLVDPDVDLARVRDGFAPASWILPEPPGPPLRMRPERLVARTNR